MQIKNHNEIQVHTTRWLESKRQAATTTGVEKLEPHASLLKMSVGQPWKDIVWFHKVSNTMLLRNS